MASIRALRTLSFYESIIWKKTTRAIACTAANLEAYN